MDEPSSAAETSTQAERRRSGRVSIKRIQLSPASSTKRKHDELDGEEVEVDEDANEESNNESDDEPAAEELAELKRSRKQARTTKSKASTKRARQTEPTTSLALRPAARKTKRVTKGRAVPDIPNPDIGGLYGLVFGGEEDLETIAVDWTARFILHEANAVSEIVNFVLKCAGCDIEVTSDDIEDPDNCTSRLTDIQDEFQAQKITDYPLITKQKSSTPFRRVLTSFINIFIHTIAVKDLLYSNVLLIENVQVWVGSLTSASTRPLRHTSTVVSLSIIGALAQLGKEHVNERALILRQREGEQRNKKVNKDRVAQLQATAKLEEQRSEQLDGIIRDWFDTVFVHRYRDIDARIRVDCIEYLGDWIVTYPEVFLDGQHLRYIGWVLSDASAPTRFGAVKHLQQIYKDDSKLGGLRQFTERFRARIVEIGVQDVDLNVRVSAVELLNTLRNKGLLEPDDIDTIGKLIYDIEPRIRKALTPFFVTSVEESYDAKVEELGDEIVDAIPARAEEALEMPCIDWLKFKSLVELMQAYDSESNPKTMADATAASHYDLLLAAGIESKYSQAAQGLTEKLSILTEWEALAGYLLFDYSSLDDASNNDDPKVQLIAACALNEKEETILLDVLNASVKAILTESIGAVSTAKKAKRTKAQMQALKEEQDFAAQRLASVIPRLLNKFGATPEATSAILRLQRLLSLESFEQLRQDSATYDALLEDVNKQFLTHEDQSVIDEASVALLQSKSLEDVGEITESKMQELWEALTHAMAVLCKGEDMHSRGNFHETVLATLSATVLRISKLAEISNCIEPLITSQMFGIKKVARKKHSEPMIPFECLMNILNRGVPERGISAEINRLEDILVSHTLKAIFLFFVWHVVEFKKSAPQLDETVYSALLDHRARLTDQVRKILDSRHGSDDLRLRALNTLIDVYSLIGGLHNLPFRPLAEQPYHDDFDRHPFSISGISIPTQDHLTILRIFCILEVDFARKSHRTLEPADDDEPESSDDDDNDEPEDDGSVADDDAAPDATDAQRIERQQRDRQRDTLLAEQRLCGLGSRISLAIVARVLDGREQERGMGLLAGPIGLRLGRNRGRLGQSFKEVVATLERLENEGKAPRSKRGAKTKAKNKSAPQISAELVDEDEDIVEEIEDDEDEEALRARGLVVDEDQVVGDEDEVMADADVESLLGD